MIHLSHKSILGANGASNVGKDYMVLRPLQLTAFCDHKKSAQFQFGANLFECRQKDFISVETTIMTLWHKKSSLN